MQITKICRQNATLLPIILYTDGTWLSKNGAHNAKPLSMTIGNFPRHVMNKTTAKKVSWAAKLDKKLKFFVFFPVAIQVLCYMPSLSVPKKQRQSKAFKEYKRTLYHDTLFDVLRPVRHAQRAGGFYATHNGM